MSGSSGPGASPPPDLFRIYLQAQQDGYPIEWHQTIKHVVRERADHRCVRCLHPYVKGEGAEWSACSEDCKHFGPVRMRETYREDDWSEYDLDRVGAYPGDAMYDYDAEQRRVKRWDVEAQWRILTVHHLNGVKLDCRWWNLASLCQRCHLVIQGKVRLEQPFVREHSEWFKPYAAGWYAHRYLNENLSREQTMERLDELLALEWFQKALF